MCKYPLLIRELLRHTTEEHPDFKLLKEAAVAIDEVVSNINEGQRISELQSRVIELDNLIDGLPVCQALSD